MTLTDKIEHVVIVHFDEAGDITYHVAGDGRVRLFIVDERAPHDRVYEWTQRTTAEEVADILGDSPRGHSGDGRHKAIEAKIIAYMDGRPHLAALPVDD